MVHRMSEITTISVSRETHEALRQLGKYGDSMDDIICRLIEARQQVDRHGDQK